MQQAFRFLVIIASFLAYLYLSTSPDFTFVRSYNLVSLIDTPYINLTDYERFYNFTFNLPSNKSQIYLSHNLLRKELNGYDHIATQTLIFQHFRGANVAFIGVHQKGKFYKPVRSSFGRRVGVPKTELYRIPNPDKYHSLYVYNKVVVAFSYHLEFGHFISDCICGILTVPSDILDGAHIFVRTKMLATMRNFSVLLGFDPNRFRQLPYDWIYCNDLYILESERGINALPVACKDLHDTIYRINGYDKIKPIDHIFINKFSHQWGCIMNAEEIINFSRITFPYFNWKLIDPTVCLNTFEIGRIIASARILLTASGSLSFNSIFIQPKSGIYIMAPIYFDGAAFTNAFSLDAKVFAVGTPDIKFGTNQKGGNFNVSIYNDTFPTLLHAVYKDKWPDSIRKLGKRVVNLEGMYKKLYKFYGNQTNIYQFTVNTIKTIKPYCSKMLKECMNETSSS